MTLDWGTDLFLEVSFGVTKFNLKSSRAKSLPIQPYSGDLVNSNQFRLRNNDPSTISGRLLHVSNGTCRLSGHIVWDTLGSLEVLCFHTSNHIFPLKIHGLLHTASRFIHEVCQDFYKQLTLEYVHHWTGTSSPAKFSSEQPGVCTCPCTSYKVCSTKDSANEWSHLDYVIWFRFHWMGKKLFGSSKVWKHFASPNSQYQFQYWAGPEIQTMSRSNELA